jgi:hypothetical protein
MVVGNGERGRWDNDEYLLSLCIQSSVLRQIDFLLEHFIVVLVSVPTSSKLNQVHLGSICALNQALIDSSSQLIIEYLHHWIPRRQHLREQRRCNAALKVDPLWQVISELDSQGNNATKTHPMWTRHPSPHHAAFPSLDRNIFQINGPTKCIVD